MRSPDLKRFPCLALALEAGRIGLSAPVVLGAADEVAVAAFLENQDRSSWISPGVVGKTLESSPGRGPALTCRPSWPWTEQARAKASEIVYNGSKVDKTPIH